MIEIINEEQALAQAQEITNSLTCLAEQLNQNGLFGSAVSSVDTLFTNNRWYLISNLRQLLSQIYVEHGIVQTLVEQPVDDAFRAGFEVKSSMLSADDVEELLVYCKRNNVIRAVIQASKWARLYGGGGVMIITNQNPQTPINLKAIGKDTPLEFRSVDMWELFYEIQNTIGGLEVGETIGAPISDFYNYYGMQVHDSRVLKVVGKEAPAFIRPRLQGWGMSELERVVTSLNQYFKNQSLIFELLNEAKIDVYGITGYNESLITASATQATQNRIQLSNQIKNYQNAIVMDAKDTYEQKQITFAGLAEVLLQIRQGIASDLKMPMTKLFGISSAGFNSGEDDIENYNAMIEGEVRSKIEWILVDALQIACQKVHGIMPHDLMITWNPLRILNAKEEEEVKDSQFARVTSAFSLGLMSDKEAKESINKDSLLGVEVDESAPALPPLMGGEEDEVKPATGKAGKQTPDEA